MPFQVSPGVSVREIDRTTTVPAVATNDAGFVGVFDKGPIEEMVLIENEQQLVEVFGEPTNNNYASFLSASNFLNYGNKLRVVRAAPTAESGVSAKNAGTATKALIKNHIHFNESITLGSGMEWIARTPGQHGDSLKVSVATGPYAYANANTVVINTSVSSAATGTTKLEISPIGGGGAPGAAAGVVPSAAIQVGDKISFPNGTYPSQKYKITALIAGSESDGSAAGTTVGVRTADNARTGHSNTVSIHPALIEDIVGTDANDGKELSVTRDWAYAEYFEQSPTETSWAKGLEQNEPDVNIEGDALHVAVIDTSGTISGQRGTVLEAWGDLSKAKNAKDPEGGQSIYYKTAINEGSQYIYWAARDQDHPATNGASSETGASQEYAWGITINSSSYSFGQDQTANTQKLSGGGDAASWPGEAQLRTAWDLFRNTEEVEVGVMFAGNTSAAVSRHIIQNIAEVRKDAIACVSPLRSDVVPTGTSTQEQSLTNVINFKKDELNVSSSYGVLDSGWKYIFDKYNDTFRWIPLNSDVAGCIVRTDTVADPWFSPAGYNRGQIKNSVKLAWNPNKAQRDDLYRNSINPVVNFPGRGTVLFGDKTLYGRSSAFDRINVRRLFIVLEKAISTAAKFLLFEFNDEFTRAQFRNMVEPFLRDVKGRRGIHDFRVVCDESNNPGSVIDRNEFVGDIYIKPARSINYIQLNFIAVSTGVSFTEVVGQSG